MKEIFASVLSAGFYGSVIILLVIAARLLLRKAPRSTICLLWVMVGLRLLIPFRIESSFSLQPEIPQFVGQGASPALPDVQPDNVIVPDRLPPNVTVTYDDNAVTEAVIRVVDYGAVAAGIWAVVACGIVGYTIISFLLLKRKVSDAPPVEEGIYETDAIDSPFLLGYIRPNIYLPKGLGETDRHYILAHERGHLERGDNWIKLVGFLCVSIHWFNPLVWLGYHLLCKDIEMACDEYVVKYMDLDSRKGYSAALVNCSSQHRFGACPVAFGEVSVKQRVLSVLHYRKPGFWISLACVVTIGVIVACFMTNPIAPDSTAHTELGSDQLQKCEDAVEMLQSGDCYYMRIYFEHNDPDILSSNSYNYYWRSGEDYLQCDWTQDWKNWCLYTQGKYYRKNVSDAMPPEELAYGNWTWVEQPELQFSGEPWIMNVRWGEAAVSILASDTTAMEEVITVSVNDPEAEYPYQLTFRFDRESGTLSSIRMWHSYEFAGVTYTSSATIESYSFDEREIKATIQKYYLETQVQAISDEI